MSTFIQPIDETHADCLAARDAIRRDAAKLMATANEWEPRPCPERGKR